MKNVVKDNIICPNNVNLKKMKCKFWQRPPWKMTQIALIRVLLPGKPKYWFQLFKLTQPQRASIFEPEYGTAQPQLLFCYNHFASIYALAASTINVLRILHSIVLCFFNNHLLDRFTLHTSHWNWSSTFLDSQFFFQFFFCYLYFHF